jgi:hypothetical protein
MVEATGHRAIAIVGGQDHLPARHGADPGYRQITELRTHARSRPPLGWPGR